MSNIDVNSPGICENQCEGEGEFLFESTYPINARNLQLSLKILNHGTL